MFLVGFYSPKKQSGVTKQSLSVYRWLKTNTSLSVGFVSYSPLEQEKVTDELVHSFSSLSLNQQKNKIKKMKNHFDIIVYDASSELSDNVIQILPILDSLYVVGEENAGFAEQLHHLIDFNKIFDKKVKNFVKHIEGSKTFILRENEEQKIGFADFDSDTTSSDVGSIIYDDYISHYMDRLYIEKSKEILFKIKKLPKESLGSGLYKLGIDFNKSLLFEKYISLRVGLGQDYNEAIERLFIQFVQNPYSELLQKFQNELYVGGIQFSKNHQTESDQEEEN